jgi:glycosyltransferase involved in cell wall biosynthesis
MKVLFLTSGDRVPSTRFRILPFIEHLERDGIRCSVASSIPQKYDYWPAIGFRPSQTLKRLVRWWHLLRTKLSRYDVVYVEREIFDAPDFAMEQRFRDAAPRMIVDIDDAIFLRYPEKTEAITRMADVVIAANPLLADVLRQWNDHIVVIPTGVRLASFPLKDYSVEPNPVPVVGWIGTTANLRYFAVVAEALRNLATQFEFELRLIVPEVEPLAEFDLSGVRVCHVPWDAATEVEELRKFDIGIMPLTDDSEWNGYKCPTKMLQYMSVGIPGIASPIGFTGQVVEHGVNGLVARDTIEWETGLRLLLDDRQLRIQIGQIGRETVQTLYCVEACQRLLVSTLRDLVR